MPGSNGCTQAQGLQQLSFILPYLPSELTTGKLCARCGSFTANLATWALASELEGNLGFYLLTFRWCQVSTWISSLGFLIWKGKITLCSWDGSQDAFLPQNVQIPRILWTLWAPHHWVFPEPTSHFFHTDTSEICCKLHAGILQRISLCDFIHRHTRTHREVCRVQLERKQLWTFSLAPASICKSPLPFLGPVGTPQSVLISIWNPRSWFFPLIKMTHWGKNKVVINQWIFNNSNILEYFCVP